MPNTIMRLPTFNAEASLGASQRHYHTPPSLRAAGAFQNSVFPSHETDAYDEGDIDAGGEEAADLEDGDDDDDVEVG